MGSYYRSRMYGEWFRGLIFLAQSYQSAQDQFIKKSQRVLIVTSVVVIIEQIFNYLNNDEGLRKDKYVQYIENIRNLLESKKNQWELRVKEGSLIDVGLSEYFVLDYAADTADFESYLKDNIGVSREDLCSIEELFILRDVLLHGHVYNFDVNWDNKFEDFYQIGSLLEGYGDKKNEAKSIGNKTSMLGLNLFPEEIGDRDIRICCLVLRGLIRLVNECSERKLIFNSHELCLKTNKLESELDLLDKFIDFL